MEITKQDIEETIEKLQEILEEMEANDINEIPTSCNTYGLYKFISYGSKGYLDLNVDVYELIDEEME